MPYFSFTLGIILLIVSAVMGAILLLAPGSIRLERPDCGWVGWAFNVMNLLFFLVIIPICSVMMIMQVNPPIFLCIPVPWEPLQIALEIQGAVLFIMGAALLLWSRLALRRSFRLGGVKPSSTDYLTMHGPYNFIRHPMYLSALLVLLGLTLILSSLLMAAMFIIMLLLVLRLIPEEEIQLDQAYPIAYSEYCRRVPGAMIPRGHAASVHLS